MKFISDGKQAINVAQVLRIYIYDDRQILYDVIFGDRIATYPLKEFRKGTQEKNCAAAKKYFDDLVKKLEDES